MFKKKMGKYIWDSNQEEKEMSKESTSPLP